MPIHTMLFIRDVYALFIADLSHIANQRRPGIITERVNGVTKRRNV